MMEFFKKWWWAILLVVVGLWWFMRRRKIAPAQPGNAPDQGPVQGAQG